MVLKVDSAFINSFLIKCCKFESNVKLNGAFIFCLLFKSLSKNFSTPEIPELVSSV